MQCPRFPPPLRQEGRHTRDPAVPAELCLGEQAGPSPSLLPSAMWPCRAALLPLVLPPPQPQGHAEACSPPPAGVSDPPPLREGPAWADHDPASSGRTTRNASLPGAGAASAGPAEGQREGGRGGTVPAERTRPSRHTPRTAPGSPMVPVLLGGSGHLGVYRVPAQGGVSGLTFLSVP